MASSTLWRAVWRRYSRSGLAAAGERSSLGLLNPVSCAICSNGLRRTNKEDERRTFSSPALQAFYATVRHDKQSLYLSSLSQFQLQSRRNLETEAAFHPVANETLETIQDSVDGLLDSQTAIDYEVSLAAGVLTIKMFPHGTWVINKQTPNLQLWWSSPLSGPKRFEYDDDDKLWFSTKDGLNLGRSLSQEIQHIYPQLDPLDLVI